MGKIDQLEHGINTQIGKIFYDDGILLSGGEDQKLALSRALFRDTKVMILDEPSSALDPISENQLLESFKDIAQDKMVIYISHRLSSTKNADAVIFLKDSKIHEVGSHEELMANKGDYSKYYQMQAQHYTLDKAQ